MHFLISVGKIYKDSKKSNLKILIGEVGVLSQWRSLLLLVLGSLQEYLSYLLATWMFDGERYLVNLLEFMFFVVYCRNVENLFNKSIITEYL